MGHRIAYIEETPVRPRSPRKKNKGWLDTIRSLPCTVCKKPDCSDAAHIRFADRIYYKRHSGLGEKPNDVWVVPLCRDCHVKQHSENEASWWRAVNIDPLWIAMLLRQHSEDRQILELIVSEAGS